MQIPYTKPYLTPIQQVTLLIQRGMSIDDTDKAASCLARIGYYRLSAYWYPFRKSEVKVKDPKDLKSAFTVVLDDFRDGTDFTTIMALYVFDKKLRMIVLDALERVEIAVRTDISLLLGRIDPWAHRDPQNLHGNFAKKEIDANAHPGVTLHTKWLASVDDKFQKSKEDFSKHFKHKYSGELPIWMSAELWDFGALSYLYSGLKVPDRNVIAAQYGLSNCTQLETWLRCLNDVRNVCAHHSRLWNKPLASRPSWPTQGEIPILDHLIQIQNGNSRLYAAVLILHVLIQKINPNTSWLRRLHDHVKTLPDNPIVNLSSAGFPIDWESQLGLMTLQPR